MHLFFLVRGIKQQVDLFTMFMQCQMFKWTRTNLATGEKEIVQVQGALRVMPIGYEYVFPEECLAEVLTMLDIKEIKKRWKLTRTNFYIIKKLMGVGGGSYGIEPIPEYEPTATNRFVETRGVAIYPIGIKKDARGILQGYEQELL